MDKISLQLLTIFGFLILVMVTGCDEKELTFQEIRSGMNTTFIGSQFRDGNEFFDNEEVQLINTGDSTSIVVGRFQDSLEVKITSVDFSLQSVMAKGPEIPLLIYSAESESLYIQHVPGSSIKFTFRIGS